MEHGRDSIHGSCFYTSHFISARRESIMKFLIYLALAFVCACFTSKSFGQNQPVAPDSSILKEYDQALDQVAEKAMRSVVEIDVTGYGVPEHDDSGSQLLQRQRSLGSGVIV